jgi:hypothetical protein
MEDKTKLINKIIENHKNINNDIQKILDKLSIISDKVYIEKIKEKQNIINQIINNYIIENTIKYDFELINNIEKCNLLIIDIHSLIKKELDKMQYNENYLSKTFINESFNLYKNILSIYNKINKLEETNKKILIEIIANNEVNKIELNVLNYVKNIQELFIENSYSTDLYCELINKIIKKFSQDKIIFFTILDIIEEDKSRILLGNNIKLLNSDKTIELNPYYKNFGLLPSTKSISINEISKIVFSTPVKNIKQFIKLCQKKNYGVIIINKIISNPILYNITNLLDWKESKQFSNLHKSNSGININLIERYNNVQKSEDKVKWNFSIESYGLKLNKYNEEMNNFVIVLDSLLPDTYRLNSLKLNELNNYFIRISKIKELYEYCSKKTNKLIATRISQYNKICLSNSLNNLFSPVKVNMEKIQTLSSIIDPKYLRNEIYILLLEYFNKKLSSNIKDNYTYGNLIHNEEFLDIFSDVLEREFHNYLYENYSEYLTGHIQISEIICSLLNVIYIYQRTFTKEIHDYFKNNLFNFSSDTTLQQIRAHFDEMIRTVLNNIITIESNVYQTILYKINLLKNTLI